MSVINKRLERLEHALSARRRPRLATHSYRPRLVASLSCDGPGSQQAPGEVGLSRRRAVRLAQTGVPVFSRLQAAMDEGRTDELILFVFDLLYLDGESTAGLP
jgi:hypothetical protein